MHRAQRDDNQTLFPISLLRNARQPKTLPLANKTGYLYRSRKNALFLIQLKVHEAEDSVLTAEKKVFRVHIDTYT